MNQEELDNLYLPSRWSKRLGPDSIVENHLQTINEASEKARSGVPSDLNVPYGALPKEKLDIFGTDLDNGAPIFVFIHGGYWQEECLGRSNYHYIATNLHSKDIKSIFVGYELCPNVSMAEIVKEVEVAVKKCIDYAKTNKSRGLFLAGYSAGAQLVAIILAKFIPTLLKSDQDFIKAAFLIAGIYDLKEIPKTSINFPLKLNETTAMELSPLHQKISGPHDISFYIIAAGNDSPQFKKQAQEFCDKLENSGMKSSFVIVQDVDHFNVIELLSDQEFQLSQLISDVISNSFSNQKK